MIHCSSFFALQGAGKCLYIINDDNVNINVVVVNIKLMKKKSNSKKTLPAYHHGDLKNALFDAALSILVKEGVGSLTLREVARQAKVSHAAPYRHFKDKEALLAAISEEGFRRLSEYMLAEIKKYPDDFRKQFEASGVGYVRFAKENPEYIKLMFGNYISCRDEFPSLTETGRFSFMILVDTIRRCQENNIMKKGDPLEIAVSAWSLTHGLSLLLIDGHLASLHLFKSDKELYEVVGSILTNIFDGLKI